MAEIAIATGLFGVASIGITLTKTLHELGTTAWEAGEQTDSLSYSISYHCRALKDLGRQLKIDSPDHSAEALATASELEVQSKVVLSQIRKLLPRPRRGRDDLSLKDRLSWSLRKSRVKYLVGQLEYLRSTVTLLRHVLSTVPNLRKYRHSDTCSPELREEIREELTEAQNLMYERCRAQQNLSELVAEDEAENDEVRTIEPPEVRSSSPSPPYSLVDPVQHPGNCLAEIDSYASQLTGNDSRVALVQSTSAWLAQLYGRWTTLEDNDDSTREPLGRDDVANLAARVSSDSIVSHASSDDEVSISGETQSRLEKNWTQNVINEGRSPELQTESNSTSSDLSEEGPSSLKSRSKAQSQPQSMQVPNIQNKTVPPTNHLSPNNQSLHQESAHMYANYHRAEQPQAPTYVENRLPDITASRSLSANNRRINSPLRHARSEAGSDTPSLRRSPFEKVGSEYVDIPDDKTNFGTVPTMATHPSHMPQSSTRVDSSLLGKSNDYRSWGQGLEESVQIGQVGPDLVWIRLKNDFFPLHFVPYAISDGLLLVGDLRKYAGEKVNEDPKRLQLWYKKQCLSDDKEPATTYGVKMKSIVTVVLEHHNDER